MKSLFGSLDVLDLEGDWKDSRLTNIAIYMVALLLMSAHAILSLIIITDYLVWFLPW